MARKSRDFGHMMASQLDDSFCIVDDFAEHCDEHCDPLVGFGTSVREVPPPTARLSSAGAASPSDGTSPQPLTSELVSELEHAKETPDVAFDVLGRAVTVSMTGARAGLYYAHVLKTEGVKVYVHDNFEIDAAHQPVRIQYESSALTGRNLYEVHARVCRWLNELGLEMLRVECFDGELPPYLTRIEYQLRREVLKGFGIDSLRDLRDCEASLVEYLTHSWFRILRNVKVRGSECEQAIHPLWAQVGSAFKTIFCGSDNPRDLSSVGRHKISCETSHLVAQAAGCLASAVAITSGAVGSDKEAFDKIMQLLADAKLVKADVVNFRTARLKSDS